MKNSPTLYEHTFTHPGGRMRFDVSGDFSLGKGGVLAMVEISQAGRMPAAESATGLKEVYAKAEKVRTITEPGEYDVGLTAGRVTIAMSCADDKKLPRVEFGPCPRARKQPTMEQRLRAVEGKVDASTPGARH
jgi:hypothetical protein